MVTGLLVFATHSYAQHQLTLDESEEMSTTDSNMPGIKGKRVPGRPGRFDPTEPLHMTTRRAAKTGPSNGSPSVNGSIDGDASRRGSLDESRPITSHSNGSQFESGSRRLSAASSPNIDLGIATNGLSSTEKKDGQDLPIPLLSPFQQTPSPSRKRKRSTSASAVEVMQPGQPQNNNMDTLFVAEVDHIDDDDEAHSEGDTVELVRPEDLSDREDSQQSSRSDDQALPHESYSYQSMDVTPLASEPGSPESGESRSKEGPPLANELEAALEDIEPQIEDDAEDPGEDMDVDVEAEVADDEEVEDVEEQLRSDDEEPPARRFGGRRRAQHPIPKVERAMQRQAELKSAYRALARVQKTVLAEIAQRTIDDLETKPELHTRTVEYQGVRNGLDAALEARQYRLKSQLELNMEQLKRTLEFQQRHSRDRCEQKLRDLKEFRLARLEHATMELLREAQKSSTDEGYLTDDERDDRPNIGTAGSRLKGLAAINDAYDSRSRVVTEIMRTTDDMERRFEMQKLLQGLDEDDKITLLRRFTVMDEGPRNAAVARREGLANIKMMAEAAAEFERRSNIPIIRNNEAHGLQLLGDLASRPSIKAPTRDPLPPKPRRQSLPQKSQSRPIPPQLHIPPNHQPTPIPLEMSPRTTQAMGNRFENPMPPPETPRQRTTPFIRSPEATRRDQPLPSPTLNPDRFNNRPDQPVRTPDKWLESRRATFSDYRPGSADNRKPPEPRTNTQFSSPQSNDRSTDNPLWRAWSSSREPSTNIHRRASSQSERPPFSLLSGLPARDERRNEGQPPIQQRQPSQDMVKKEPIQLGPFPNRLPFWRDQSSRPGATDSRPQPGKPSIEFPRRPPVEAQPAPPSRQLSSFSAREYRPPGLQPREAPSQERPGPPRPTLLHKTNKEERDGMSRKDWSRRLSKSIGSLKPNEPSVSGPQAGGPSERPPWRAPALSQHSPPARPPLPSPSYQPPSFSQASAPSNFRPTQPSSDFNSHRSGFPPRPTSSTQDRLPPTPLYVVPQQQQQQQPQQQQQHHPPPPGVPPEQYNRPFAPPPPPGYQPPPAQAPHTPQAGFPQSAPSPSFISQFGGQPLAPAGQSLYPSSFRPAPAFAQQAQQQQQQQSTLGNRRRTQSDANQQNTRFQNWTPAAGRAQ